MSLFSKKTKKKSSTNIIITEMDEILGILDEVFRKRISLSFNFKGRDIGTDILFLEKKTFSMRVQSSGTNQIPNNAELLAGFSLDKTWWSFATKFMLISEKPHLLIPKVIKHNERRKSPRTSFSPREPVKVTILEGLGSGHGVFGLAKDVSTGGMSVQIEKAMHLASEREVPPTDKLFGPAAKLAMVKINRIPGCPQIETQGIARRTYRDGKWYVAFQFDKLSKAHATMIGRFIEPRVLEFKFTRRSMKKREEMEGRMENTGPGVASPAAGPSGHPTSPTAAAATASPTAPAGSRDAQVSPAENTAAPFQGNKTKALVVGDELMAELSFLSLPSSPIEVISGLSPVTIIKILTEEKPKLMLCPLEFKGRSMVEVLDKIFNMGVGSNATIIVFADELPAKDRIKFKMMQIEDHISLPVEDEKACIESLRKIAGS